MQKPSFMMPLCNVLFWGGLVFVGDVPVCHYCRCWRDHLVTGVSELQSSSSLLSKILKPDLLRLPLYTSLDITTAEYLYRITS